MTSVVSLNRHSPFWAPRHEKKGASEFDFNSVYQPIFSPTHQRLVGFEALVRAWRNRQSVSPIDLFRQARENQQTAELDRHLLHLHLDRFAEQARPVWLFLNINPATCVHPQASLQRLAKHCRHLGVAPAQVVLELVETASEKPQALLAFIQQAKGLGFQIAIDDFGVGDSNFERLWQMDPLIVKLDRSLLVNAAHNQRARQLLESLVRMIRESGSLVLLEGIENEAQARIALATEADLIQGFLLGTPDTLDGNLTEPAEARLRRLIKRTQCWTEQDCEAHEGFLRLLRFEILEACHRLIRQEPIEEACASLLDINGIKRCFLLDQFGVQQGNPAHAVPERRPVDFNPLYRSSGASWAHREYFQNAMARPQQISASRPYVALPDAARTVTLSTGLSGHDRQLVFCVDLHPNELFDGQLCFPPTL